MKDSKTRTGRQSGSARTALLLSTAFLVGVGATTFFFYKRGQTERGIEHPLAADTAPALSERTIAVLQGLPTPVEIRFYSLLDSQRVPDSTKGFADRVRTLLTAYERSANGKLALTSIQAFSEEAANAASADRIQAFNRDSGQPCFLGLVVSCQDRKETIPSLAVEWEPALESDLTRSILRLATPAPPPSAAVAITPLDENAVKAVREALPNLASLPQEEATRILREKALKSFSEAARDLQSRLQQAEQRYTEAEADSLEQQAALAEVQKLQTEKTDRLKQITAQLQAQIVALEHLKRQ